MNTSSKEPGSWQTKRDSVTWRSEFLKSDFMRMDVPDDSFDAAYAIEATVHAPTKVDCYGEVFRVLKPGGYFAAYEYCVTAIQRPSFNPDNPTHRQTKSDIETGGALPDIPSANQIDDAHLRQVGFELLETRDLAENPGLGLPWYQPRLPCR